MIFDPFLEYLQYERNYSTHTVLSYHNDLSQFSDFAASVRDDISVEEIDSDLIRLWLVSLMEQNLSPLSVKRKLSALKSYFRYLLKSGLVKKNPVMAISGPKSVKKIPSFVKEDEMNLLLDEVLEADSDFVQLRNNTIIHLFYLTGIRRAELIGLKDQDVDFSANVIKVTGKRNKQRIIPIGGELKELLVRYLEERDVRVGFCDGHVFVKEDGEAVYPMLVHRLVKSKLAGVKLERKSSHVLRHTFATTMLNNGAQLNSVKELLGHSSLASTEVYTHTTFEELKKTYNTAHPRAGHSKKGG